MEAPFLVAERDGLGFRLLQLPHPLVLFLLQGGLLLGLGLGLEAPPTLSPPAVLAAFLNPFCLAHPKQLPGVYGCGILATWDSLASGRGRPILCPAGRGCLGFRLTQPHLQLLHRLVPLLPPGGLLLCPGLGPLAHGLPVRLHL